MSSAGNQNPWAPYSTYKDCSQAICSIYCPQWCYFIFPPPPPFTIGDDGSDSTDFSPLIIAVIGILASAFILISYYTIISKYCRRRRGENSTELNDQNREQTSNGAWLSAASGLDEALIKSITVCKYKKGDGFIEGTDCSVCLSEFQENESLRLLPKCSHAFHLPCIDTWLKAHASCPLCRANITPTNIFPAQESVPIQETPPNQTNVSAQEYQHRMDDAVLVIQDFDRNVHEEVVISVGEGDDPMPKITSPIEEIEAQDHPIQPFRRSISLNFPVCESTQVSISIADVLCNSEDDDGEVEEHVRDKGKNRSGILNLVKSSPSMKRSISTGRFMFTRYEKGRGSVIPN